MNRTGYERNQLSVFSDVGTFLAFASKDCGNPLKPFSRQMISGVEFEKCSFSDMTARVLDTRTDVISYFPSTRLTYKLQRVVNMFASCNPYLRAEGNISCTFFNATSKTRY